MSAATGYGSKEQAVTGSKLLTPEKRKSTPAVKNRNSSFNKKDPASVENLAAINKNSGTEKEAVSGKKAEQTSAIVKKEKAPDPKEVKALVNKKDRKIEDIKEVYNRIDKVYLYSGEVVTGAIIERGESYSILTTGGIVKVSRKDIQSNEIIR